MRAGWVLCGLTGLLLAGGGWRLAAIAASRGDELRARADRQQTAAWTIPARRGEILDTRGRVLAGTLREPSVFVDPGVIEDGRFVAYSVGPVLGMDPAGLARSLAEWRGHTRFEWLKRRIPDAMAEELERVVRGRGLAGVGVQYEMTRTYPQAVQQPIAPHVLGFVGRDRYEVPGTSEAYDDLRGLVGIEAEYNDVLVGRPGRQAVTVDRDRRPVCTPENVLRPAVDGATIVLTIDAFIQQVTQEALRKAITEHKAQYGTAVVIDPQTGEVLAMATVPDFDPADPVPAGVDTTAEKDRLRDLWRNRAVADSFEPGSVFKPFVASTALDEGLVHLDDVFQINGPAHSFGRRVIHDTHTYQALTLREVISKSSNIGMGMVGAKAGSERLYRYVRMFGFGDITGIELPGEHTGLVQDLKRWNPGFSPQSVPIGQEVGVTPLQLAVGYSVFANGGVLMRPRIVRGVIASDGTTLMDNSAPIALRRVLDEAVAEKFRLEALVEVVKSGTGTRGAVPGYQVFGKTGTAQIARPGAGYVPGQYVGSFVGGAPADDPRVLVAVSVFKPGGRSYYGGTIAAPAVKEIIGETLAYLRVPPTESDDAVDAGPGPGGD